VKRVLASGGGETLPVLSVIQDQDVEDMRQSLREAVSQDIEEGMKVRISHGTYAKLEGEVVGLEGNTAFVHVVLRSFQAIQTVPRIFLDPIEDEEDE